MLNLLIADGVISTCEEIAQFCRNYETIHVLPFAHNGRDVLSSLEINRVDVLLMDIIMPVMDGLSVLNSLGEQNRPAVFIHTAFLDNRLMQELQKLSVVYCFVKPMGPEHIIPRILQLTRSSQTTPEPELPIAPLIAGSEELSAQITRQIRAVGIPAHLRGYHYLRSAIQYSAEAKDPSSVAVTKDIYPHISRQYNTRPALVERAIRNAIEVAWTRGNAKILNQYFGYTIDDLKGKPTNAEFIAMIADRVRMEL